MKENLFKTVGEFEAQESVTLMWPLTRYATKTTEYDRDAVSIEIVENLVGNVEVIISCYNDEQKSYIINVLQKNQIDTNSIKFMIFPSDIIYPRDFGAEVLVAENGERALVDFDFNTYGEFPNFHPMSRLLEKYDRFHAEFCGIENTIFTRLIGEGGDREFNGNGVLMTIEDTEVNKRNNAWTKEEVEEEFKRIFNIKKVVWMPLPTYDDEDMLSGAVPDENGEYKAYRSATANGHIDEMCRFVSEDTILLAHISEEEAAKSELHKLNKERLDKAYEVLKNEVNIDGKPFNIIKMPVPEPIYVEAEPGDDVYESFQMWSEFCDGKLSDGTPYPTGKIKLLPALSYCNFLITNGLVLAQKYYREGMPIEIKKKDEEAFKILQKAFPDRKVVAIDTLSLNLYGGGIHCNTRNIPKAR